jgi:hypothetical protein
MERVMTVERDSGRCSLRNKGTLPVWAERKGVLQIIRNNSKLISQLKNRIADVHVILYFVGRGWHIFLIPRLALSVEKLPTQIFVKWVQQKGDTLKVSKLIHCLPYFM